jgi:hypothetical protein
MRVRVQPSWRTRLLFLIAFVAAGAIAYSRYEARQRAAQTRPPPAAPAIDGGYVIDVELAD